MRIILFLIISILTFSACSQEKKGGNENEKLIQEYFAFFNKHDWKGMANLYAERADFKDPSLGPGIVKQTHEQIIKKYGELSQTFPDVSDKILNVYSSGEHHVIVEFVSTGTAPDSSRFELPICTIFKIENGLISEDFTYYDNFEE